MFSPVGNAAAIFAETVAEINVEPNIFATKEAVSFNLEPFRLWPGTINQRVFIVPCLLQDMKVGFLEIKIFFAARQDTEIKVGGIWMSCSEPGQLPVEKQ